MEVQSNVAPGGRPLESVISTHHGDRTVLTGIHQRRHDRRQGGVRFVTVGSLEELAHLAHGMSEKAAAAGIAIDGMKALVICPAGIPESAEERASLLADHIRQAISVDRNLLFGPDMGCQEDGAIVTDLLERVADRPDVSITTTKPASARVNQ